MRKPSLRDDQRVCRRGKDAASDLKESEGRDATRARRTFGEEWKIMNANDDLTVQIRDTSRDVCI
jgi:hypothetical protein